MNPIHTLQQYIRKIHFNIILWSVPRSSEWSLLFRLSDQNMIVLTISDEEYKLCSSSLCSFLHLHVTSSLLDPNILLSSLSLCYLEMAMKQILWPDVCGFCDFSTLIPCRYSYAGLILQHIWQVYSFVILNQGFLTFKTWDHIHSLLTDRLPNKWGNFIGTSWKCIKNAVNLLLKTGSHITQ
jgi:hypothetical protein